MLRSQERRFEKIVADKFAALKKKKHNTFTDIILDHCPEYRNGSAQKRRRLQMAVGHLWPYYIALYGRMKFLPCLEYPTPTADVYDTATNTFIEIKNNENTMNSTSLSGTLDKMCDLMEKYPGTKGIIGCINAKKQEGRVCIKKFRGHEITCYYGDVFLEYIFGNDVDDVVKHIRKTFRPLVEEFCNF